MEYRNANMIKKMTRIYHSDINFTIIVAIFEKIQISIEKNEVNGRSSPGEELQH